jgi:hypothetical protein
LRLSGLGIICIAIDGDLKGSQDGKICEISWAERIVIYTLAMIINAVDF